MKTQINNQYQIHVDVLRSMNNFTYFNSLSEKIMENYKIQLEEIIMNLLNNNGFQYYQGYNYFCSVFLLILGREKGLEVAEKASQYYFKDLLAEAFPNTIKSYMIMFNNLLNIGDFELYNVFSKFDVLLLLKLVLWSNYSMDSIMVCSKH